MLIKGSAQHDVIKVVVVSFHYPQSMLANGWEGKLEPGADCMGAMHAMWPLLLAILPMAWE